MIIKNGRIKNKKWQACLWVLAFSFPCAYAEETNVQVKEENSAPMFSINFTLQPQFSSYLFYQTTTNAKIITHTKKQYQFGWMHVETGAFNQQSDKVANNLFYLQGSINLLNSDNYNFAVLANIEQANKENVNALESFSFSEINQPNTLLYTRFGLSGSYLLTPVWKVTGSVTYSKPMDETAKNFLSHNDSIALIGTTYSF